MKIDYVVPYVDGNDENWRKLYMQNKHMNENANNIEEVKKRFSPNRLFKYQFRGIEKYMPWINTVHLIVQSDSQIPSWINQDMVHIVKHEDYMPKECLPTFNSSTMECFLHQIPGLAELFIYSNDDFYITNYCKPSDFFMDGVMPISSVHRRHVNPNNNESYERMNMNITKFICEKLNKTYVPYTFIIQNHVQRAMNKTIFKNIFDTYKKDIMKRCSIFRTDYNFSQAFFTMYYIASVDFKYKNNTLKHRRFDVITEFNMLKKFIFKENAKLPQLLCINNNDNDKDIILMKWFDNLFPEKSKYEI